MRSGVFTFPAGMPSQAIRPTAMIGERDARGRNAPPAHDPRRASSISFNRSRIRASHPRCVGR